MSYVVNPKFLRFGGARKTTFEMSETELKWTAQSILERAKEKAFAKGLPIYYAVNHVIYAEYADGRKEIVKKSQHATQSVRSRRSQRHW